MVLSFSFFSPFSLKKCDLVNFSTLDRKKKPKKKGEFAVPESLEEFEQRGDELHDGLGDLSLFFFFFHMILLFIKKLNLSGSTEEGEIYDDSYLNEDFPEDEEFIVQEVYYTVAEKYSKTIEYPDDVRAAFFSSPLPSSFE